MPQRERLRLELVRDDLRDGWRDVSPQHHHIALTVDESERLLNLLLAECPTNAVEIVEQWDLDLSVSPAAEHTHRLERNLAAEANRTVERWSDVGRFEHKPAFVRDASRREL